MTRILYLLGLTVASAAGYLLLRLLRPEAEHGEWKPQIGIKVVNPTPLTVRDLRIINQ